MKLWLWRIGFLTISGTFRLVAQTQSPSQDAPIPTLHVYTNLVQVPTLVLEGSLNQIKTPIAEKRFSISIDSGPWFQVTHARLEGNDPIALSILLDNSATDLMPKISDAIAALAPSMPSDRDSISVYAMGCGFTPSLNNVPPESAELRLGGDAALRPGIILQRDRNVP